MANIPSQSFINEIKEVVNTFIYFIERYESELNSKPSVEEIKDDFKSAIFIEKTIRSLEEQDIINKFNSCLNIHLEELKRTSFYELNFYKYACDHLLLKYFKARKYDIEIAIRMYSSHCDETRFESVVGKHIVDSAVNETILDYFVNNKSDINTSELECRLMLLNLKCEIEKGKLDAVRNNVENMFDSYKIDKYLSLFLGILILDELSEEEESIKAMILHILLNKMEDRSFKSKEFWLTLIQNLDKSLLTQISVKYRSVLDSLLSFLTYCTCLMEHDERLEEWVGDKDKSICPEITFDNIVAMYKCLISTNAETVDHVRSHLNNTKTNINIFIWKEIE